MAAISPGCWGSVATVEWESCSRGPRWIAAPGVRRAFEQSPQGLGSGPPDTAVRWALPAQDRQETEACRGPVHCPASHGEEVTGLGQAPDPGASALPVPRADPASFRGNPPSADHGAAALALGASLPGLFGAFSPKTAPLPS